MFFFFKKYPLKLCPRLPCPHRRPVHTGAAQSQLCTLGSREGPVVPFLTENKGVLSQAVAAGFRGREEGGPAVPVPVGPHACLPGVPPGRHAEPPAPTRVHSALGPPPPQQQWLLPPVLRDLLYKALPCCRRPGPGNEIQRALPPPPSALCPFVCKSVYCKEAGCQVDLLDCAVI